MPGWGMAFGAASGLSLLFVGLRVLSGELAQAIQPSMQSGLAGRSSAASGFLPGLLFAGISQSSSAVAATSVGLVHAGALSFERAFAVILGANVGTTLTAQLSALSFSLAPYTLHIIVCGLAVRLAGAIAVRVNLAGRLQPLRGIGAYGAALAGIGAVLMGLNILGASLAPFVRLPGVVRLLTEASGHPALAALLGAAVTAVAQSSSAVTATVVQLSAAGTIPFETSLALVLGSNVGTVATTLLAAVGLSAAAKKTAVADLIFNVAGVGLALLLFPSFVGLLSVLSPAPGQRVAHAHTLFNAATAALALPFLGKFVGWVDALVGDAPRGGPPRGGPRPRQARKEERPRP